MLVQYETTIEKSAPSILVEEASTLEAKGKGAGLAAMDSKRYLH